MIWSRSIAAVVVASSLLVATSPTYAALYDFSLSGTVWDVQGLPEGMWSHVDIGSVVTVTYRMDSEEEDIVPGETSGIYYYDSIAVDIDGVSLVIEPLGVLDYLYVTTNSSFGGSADEYRVQATSIEQMIGVGVNLIGWDGTFQSDDIPLELDLDDFFDRNIGVLFGTFDVEATVDSFVATPVPGPASALTLLFMMSIARVRPRSE